MERNGAADDTPTSPEPGKGEASAARQLGLNLPPHAQRWSLTELLAFLQLALHGSTLAAEVAQIQRSLQRLVLRTWVAARPQLAQAQAEGLQVGLARRLCAAPPDARVWNDALLRHSDAPACSQQLKLAGPHEFASTFELTAFDVLLDDNLVPWLMELNTTPSLAAEEASGADIDIKAPTTIRTPTYPRAQQHRFCCARRPECAARRPRCVTTGAHDA